jgi:HEAT repeat protein
VKRTAIWSETLLMIAVYAFAIWAAEKYLVSVESRDVALALAFVIVQTTAIILTLAALFVRKTLQMRATLRSEQLRGELQEALALEAAGQDQLRHLRSLQSRSRRDVENGIADFLAAIRGPASARIVALAQKLGIETPDPADRLERLFAAAAAGSLLTRAAITEELEPDAAQLASVQIPRALTSSDPSRVLAALDMLRAWKRVLPVRNVEALLHHDSGAVRAAALRALPWVESIDAPRTVRIGLRDRDPRVRIAAADAAARMGLEDAMPQLAENLAGDDRDVALASAFALASLSGGAKLLEQTLTSPNRTAASLALEALEKASMQRLELA